MAAGWRMWEYTYIRKITRAYDSTDIMPFRLIACCG